MVSKEQDPACVDNSHTKKVQIAGAGRKIPLFSEEELKKASKRKKHKKREEHAKQLLFWSDTASPRYEIQETPTVFDPDGKLFAMGRNYDNPHYRPGRISPISQEMREKRTDLRSRIGLPVARGKDPHVNDKFYKFLVRNVVRMDSFGIFAEYDRVLGDVHPELEEKIQQVGSIVKEVLQTDLRGWRRYELFHELVKEFHETGCITRDLIHPPVTIVK